METNVFPKLARHSRKKCLDQHHPRRGLPAAYLPLSPVHQLPPSMEHLVFAAAVQSCERGRGMAYLTSLSDTIWQRKSSVSSEGMPISSERRDRCSRL